jgi:hypothetical protein
MHAHKLRELSGSPQFNGNAIKLHSFLLLLLLAAASPSF